MREHHLQLPVQKPHGFSREGRGRGNSWRNLNAPDACSNLAHDGLTGVAWQRSRDPRNTLLGDLGERNGIEHTSGLPAASRWQHSGPGRGGLHLRQDELSRDSAPAREAVEQCAPLHNRIDWALRFTEGKRARHKHNRFGVEQSRRRLRATEDGERVISHDEAHLWLAGALESFEKHSQIVAAGMVEETQMRSHAPNTIQLRSSLVVTRAARSTSAPAID